MNTLKTSVNKQIGIVLIVVISILLLSFIAPGYGAKESRTTRQTNGERLYMANCEACHMSGKNVIKPEKELVRSEKIATQKIFKEFISKKHGVMPPFEDLANNSNSVKDLYHFVKQLKISSWEYPMEEPTHGNEIRPDHDQPAPSFP